MGIPQEPSVLRLLLVEDSDHDVLALRRAFQHSHVAIQVTTYPRAEEALARLDMDPSAFDLLVSDYHLPGMSGLDLCRAVLARGISLPLVLLTGAGTERLAVEALKAGVDDYLIKDGSGGYLELLPVVLPAVVQQYRDRLARRQAEAAREELIVELQAALAKIKTLRGLLPICAACKKIRDDQGYWTQVEVYVEAHSEAEFSHGMCPDCTKKWYPDLEDGERAFRKDIPSVE